MPSLNGRLALHRRRLGCVRVLFGGHLVGSERSRVEIHGAIVVLLCEA